MKVGLYGINLGPCARPETAGRVARAAEAAGLDSLWTGEHVVLPDPQTPPSPVPPDFPMLDPAVALTWAAAHTEGVLLATGIVILPQRNPLVLAKEMASLDVLSGGRLVLGVGVGYLRPEFEALGAPFDERAERMDEYLDAIVALWTLERPRYQGRHVRFAGIDARPRPVQRPHPPIVMGGQSAPAFRRAVRRAAGWYGFALDPEATTRCIGGLERAAREVERPDGLGPLEISVTPPAGIPDRDAVRRYADLGVHRLVLLPTARDEAGLLDLIRRAGETLLG
jgi:probable F420-dependent oxidoreductase